MEREADLPSTFVEYIRESITVLQTWRDSKQPSKNLHNELTKCAFSYGIAKGSEKTLHEVGLRLHEVLIREGHELLQGKYNYFVKLENCVKWVREAIPEGEADSPRALLSASTA